MASVVTVLGFLLLTATSIMAVIRSRGDTAAVSFVAASYLILVLLFYFLRRFEAAPAGSVLRDRARVGVWATTTLLMVMFSWRVAAVMPWPVAAGVWLMGGSAVAGGSYTLFLLPH
ncbi:hypothetical protein SETIT_4G035900v2 [Setaria italica]|uniref:Uncharacterized protein n=1 Tax=Setaria italica TaxID=4555 RepID=K3Y0Y0_SETIT|nr:hypothetical protein SETIT_4G035900v2 [Setaria italica]